jgi:hypothetical protein
LGGFEIAFAYELAIIQKEGVPMPQTLEKLPTVAVPNEPQGFVYSPQMEADDPFYCRATQVEIFRGITEIETALGVQREAIEA